MHFVIIKTNQKKTKKNKTYLDAEAIIIHEYHCLPSDFFFFFCVNQVSFRQVHTCSCNFKHVPLKSEKCQYFLNSISITNQQGTEKGGEKNKKTQMFSSIIL